MSNHRIEDFDFYLGLAILCFALNAPVCGSVALGFTAMTLHRAKQEAKDE